MLGVLDDVRRRLPTAGQRTGETLGLLGDTRDEFDGPSGTGQRRPPRRHAAHGRPVPGELLAEVLAAASRDGLASAAHDLSEGGLIQAVVEAGLAGETGCRLVLPENADPFVLLFSESAGRALVAVPRTEESRFVAMCEARGLPATRIGGVRLRLGLR